MRVGLDVDGVIADFDRSFHALLGEVTGRSLPPVNGPSVWDWPQEICNCTNKEVSAAWNYIRSQPEWWATLEPLEDMAHVRAIDAQSTQLYFITSRVPDSAKFWTEKWLRNQGIENPTVLVSGDKGPLAKGLKLTAFIDDKPSNIFDVHMASPTTQCFLKRRPFNKHLDVPMVESVAEMMGKLGEVAA